MAPAALALAACLLLLQVGESASKECKEYGKPKPLDLITVADYRRKHNESNMNVCRCARRRLAKCRQDEEKRTSNISFPWIVGISMIAGAAVLVATVFIVVGAQLHAMAAWEKLDVVNVKTGTDSTLLNTPDDKRSVDAATSATASGDAKQ